MSTKKKEQSAPESAKASPMTYESVNLRPRIIAGGVGESEADIAGLGPAPETIEPPEEK